MTTLRAFAISMLLLVIGLCCVRPAPADEPPPIQIIWDVHMDPLNGIPLAQRPTVYAAWRNAANWALDAAALRGAKITFLAVGEYMEYTLGDPANGFSLMQRLYASGGSLGTHSHSEKQIGPHQWINLSPNATPADVDELWADHVTLADQVVQQALGITDPAAIRAVNNTRGSHLPSDETQFGSLMQQYGFTMRQQGPEEEFYTYFKHYVMNAYRLSATHALSHDPLRTAPVDSPFGPVLGSYGPHGPQNTVQDMRLPALEARFLLELLNWLDEYYVTGRERVWTFGWATHGSDITPTGVSRNFVEPMLTWLKTNFIDQPVSGVTSAAFSSSRQSRDLYYAWEAGHPGEVPFDYPPSTTDWAQYPYLLPVARYLVDGQWVSVVSVGPARLHRVTAAAASGGPFDMYVAYPAAAVDAVVDLTSVLGTGQIAVVDPRTGLAPPQPISAVGVRKTGAILVPTVKRLALPNGDVNLDGYLDFGDINPFVAVLTGGDTDPQHRAAADINRDGQPDFADINPFVALLSGQ
jgi:hypothetical protein